MDITCQSILWALCLSWHLVHLRCKPVINLLALRGLRHGSEVTHARTWSLHHSHRLIRHLLHLPRLLHHGCRSLSFLHHGANLFFSHFRRCARRLSHSHRVYLAVHRRVSLRGLLLEVNSIHSPVLTLQAFGFSLECLHDGLFFLALFTSKPWLDLTPRDIM